MNEVGDIYKPEQTVWTDLFHILREQSFSKIGFASNVGNQGKPKIRNILQTAALKKFGE